MESHRPQVSRDTRLLFAIILIAVASLWVLARIRFPDRAPTPNPVPPVLAQLAPRSAFDDIASTLSQVGMSLRPSLLAVPVERLGPTGQPESADLTVAALRFRGDLAAAWMAAGTQISSESEGSVEIARDPAGGLALLHVSGGPGLSIATWLPRQPESPRFLIAAEVGRVTVSFRPVFVGSLNGIDSPLWEAQVWSVPRGTDLRPGTFVFTLDGAFAGLTITSQQGVAIVPSETVVALAERLSRDPAGIPADLGVRVQAMTAAIAAATGARTGVIATWVDAAGPADGLIQVTDVIETLGDQPLTSVEAWDGRVAKLGAGETVALGVRRRDGVHTIDITAAPRPSTPETKALGLGLRTIPRTGAAVVRVESHSAAFRAGIAAGDVITVIGDVRTPTAAAIARLYAAAPDGAAFLVGLTRGDLHRVVVLERRR